MHLGGPGSTNGPCFTIKDYMHRVRHVTYTIKIEKASEMQQPSCKSKLFGQTGFLFSRYINVMCQVSIFWHCWFIRRRFLNIKIINNFKPPLGTPDIPNITLEEDHPRNIWAKFG